MSQFTSVYERIRALGEQPIAEPASLKTAPAVPPPANPESPSVGYQTDPNTRPPSAAWLSPFELSEAAEREPVPCDRASNKGCLLMSFAEYLQLLDWTGRELGHDKRGAIPAFARRLRLLRFKLWRSACDPRVRTRCQGLTGRCFFKSSARMAKPSPEKGTILHLQDASGPGWEFSVPMIHRHGT